jgi:hypothetical protein
MIFKYNRTFEDLENEAIKWWPKDLEETVAEASVLPKLLETQEQFINILKLSGKDPSQIFDVLQASKMPVNLFLKHLVILADYGGELIKRLGREFKQIFKSNSMTYSFRNIKNEYIFQSMPVNGLGNVKLGIDGKAIVRPSEFSLLYKDMIMILLHGSTSESSHLASLEKCEIGMLLGDEVVIDKYVREKYLHVIPIIKFNYT